MIYQTFTLDNGLRVVHNCEPTRAMVAINLLYNVGCATNRAGLPALRTCSNT